MTLMAPAGPGLVHSLCCGAVLLALFLLRPGPRVKQEGSRTMPEGKEWTLDIRG